MQPFLDNIAFRATFFTYYQRTKIKFTAFPIFIGGFKILKIAIILKHSRLKNVLILNFFSSKITTDNLLK